MSIEFDGKTIETTPNGYLVNADDWSEGLAEHIANSEDLELTQRHWDVIKHLREEFFQNAGNQPNTRNLVKHLSKLWNEKINAKTLYDLFSRGPEQAGRAYFRVTGEPSQGRLLSFCDRFQIEIGGDLQFVEKQRKSRSG